jgi:hypothetical protein
VEVLHQMLVYKCQSLLFAYVCKVFVVLVCSNLFFINVHNAFSCFSLGCVFSFVVPKLVFCLFSQGFTGFSCGFLLSSGAIPRGFGVAS